MEVIGRAWFIRLYAIAKKVKVAFPGIGFYNAKSVVFKIDG